MNTRTVTVLLVEDDQVDPRFRKDPVHLGPVTRQRDPAIVAAQVARDQGRDLSIVLDHEDVGCCGCVHREGIGQRFGLHHQAIMARSADYSKVGDGTNL